MRASPAHLSPPKGQRDIRAAGQSTVQTHTRSNAPLAPLVHAPASEQPGDRLVTGVVTHLDWLEIHATTVDMAKRERDARSKLAPVTPMCRPNSLVMTMAASRDDRS